MRLLIMPLACLLAMTAAADEKTLDLTIGGVPWAKTVITPYDDSSKESREETYKVYTHLMDFAGKEPITKGAGGQYTHHRGLFIGWRVTTVGDKKFDTWHMTDCYQVYTKFAGSAGGAELDVQSYEIEWRDLEHKPFIREIRQIKAHAGSDGIRIFDFTSILMALDEDITLRGDSHHAGMQVRLSNELAEHPDKTVYILPEGAKRLDNDEVSGAWWVVCNATIGGKPYSVMHMHVPGSVARFNQPSDPAGVMLYSIRPYARFGAFFEPDIKKGEPLAFTFRVIVSAQPIDQAKAAALYAEYANQ